MCDIPGLSLQRRVSLGHEESFDDPALPLHLLAEPTAEWWTRGVGILGRRYYHATLRAIRTSGTLAESDILHALEPVTTVQALLGALRRVSPDLAYGISYLERICELGGGSTEVVLRLVSNNAGDLLGRDVR